MSTPKLGKVKSMAPGTPGTVEIEFPDAWNNPNWMSTMMAPLPERQTDEEAFDQIVDFWKNAITSIFSQLKCPAISFRDAQRYIRYQNESPACLSRVMFMMVQDGELMRCRSVMEQAEAKGRRKSLLGHFISALGFVYTKVTNVFNTPEEVPLDEQFVLVEICQHLTDSVYNTLIEESSNMSGSLSNSIIMASNVMDHIRNVLGHGAKDINVQTILNMLQIQGRIQKIVSEVDGHVLAWKLTNKSTATDVKTDSPSQVDISLAKLKLSEKCLSDRVDHLNAEATKHFELAKKFVKIDKKQALNHIKLKKLRELHASKCLAQLENIHKTIFTIDQAYSSRDLFNTMKIANEAMNKLESEMDPDQVAALMDGLSENISRVEEADAALGVSLESTSTIDLDDLESEFDDLAKELEQENNDLKDIVLPSVPTTPVVKTSSKSNVVQSNSTQTASSQKLKSKEPQILSTTTT